MKSKIQKLTIFLLFIGVVFFSFKALSIQDVGNIDSTETIERVTISQDGRLYAWDKHGNVIEGWPIDKS